MSKIPSFFGENESWYKIGDDYYSSKYLYGDGKTPKFSIFSKILLTIFALWMVVFIVWTIITCFF
jgi:hypothetical protein